VAEYRALHEQKRKGTEMSHTKNTLPSDLPVCQGRIHFDSNGKIYKRSTLMTEAQAKGFCRCIAANTERYMAVEAVRAPGTDNRWYVRWMPSSSTVRSTMRDYVQQQRSNRAASQAQGMVWFPTETEGWYWCTREREDGEVSQVHPRRGCDCADYIYRCEPAGLRCKHQLALETHLEEGGSNG
jgi:hypothetical protein